MGAAFALVSFTLVSFALLWLCIVHVALMLVTSSGLGPGPVLLSTLSLRLLWSCSTSWLHSITRSNPACALRARTTPAKLRGKHA